MPDGGFVVIFFGGEGGLSPSRSSFLIWLRRNTLFGSALAAGDFDGDGFADLAVGAPDYIREPENTPGSGRGAVLVWYGARFGMERRQRWQQGANGLSETSEYRDQFGAALATGDFNCDGAADLAIGAPGEEGVDGLPIGAVSVLYGSPDGLTSAGNQVWTQHSDGGGNEAQEGDRYGEVLGRGDFNGDGCDGPAGGRPGRPDRACHLRHGRRPGLEPHAGGRWAAAGLRERRLRQRRGRGPRDARRRTRWGRERIPGGARCRAPYARGVDRATRLPHAGAQQR